MLGVEVKKRFIHLRNSQVVEKCGPHRVLVNDYWATSHMSVLDLHPDPLTQYYHPLYQGNACKASGLSPIMAP